MRRAPIKRFSSTRIFAVVNVAAIVLLYAYAQWRMDKAANSSVVLTGGFLDVRAFLALDSAIESLLLPCVYIRMGAQCLKKQRVSTLKEVPWQGIKTVMVLHPAFAHKRS